MIRTNTARNTMYAWHGGQWSPLYAAASSGLVENFDALKAEIRECYTGACPGREAAGVARLLDWVISQQGKAPVVTINGREYHALPWSRNA